MLINKSGLTVLTMLEIIKVSSRGQIVIPEKVRNNMGIKEGIKLILIEKDNQLILEREDEFVKKMNLLEENKEEMGWLSLAEKNMAKIWDNPKDDEIWSKYI